MAFCRSQHEKQLLAPKGRCRCYKTQQDTSQALPKTAAPEGHRFPRETDLHQTVPAQH